MASSFIALGWTGGVPLWLAILVISRDVVIVGVVAIVNLASGPRTFRPSIWGKLATATYIVAIVVVMYYNWQQEESAIVDVMVWTALALTLVSSGDYVLRLRHLASEQEPTAVK